MRAQAALAHAQPELARADQQHGGLFAQRPNALAPPWAAGSSGGVTGVDELAATSKTGGNTEGGTAGGTAGAVAGSATDSEILSDDPQQWPLARLRLLGLWQQGPERLAILAAGPHWVRVSPGQRVTREGHRVVAITDAGVSLRLAQTPLLQLGWGLKKGDGDKQ